jgi:hypothetical protein
MNAMKISRRSLLQSLGILLSALPLNPHLPLVRRAVLSLHMDRPVISTDAHGPPYLPRGTIGGALALSTLSEADIRRMHPYL